MTGVSRAAERNSPPRRSARAGQTGSLLFDGYLEPDRPHPGVFDEMFSPDGAVRAPYRAVRDVLAPAVAEPDARPEALDRASIGQDTLAVRGRRPIPLDVVPRVISAGEWSQLQRGIVQRVRALEAFLADVHGDAQIVRDGVLPRRLITRCARFHRVAANLDPPGGVRIHVAGLDLVRDQAGAFRLLGHNLRNPSGVGSVLENRRTMARVVPDLLSEQRVRHVGDYCAHLLRALLATAPNVADPVVVVLTPGADDHAYPEHTLLARRMGVELVEGRDLFCRDHSAYLRTARGERQVDVIYRRIEDEFLDPLQFDPDSVLGVAGVLNAARAGNVAIANAPGNGVGDDRLVSTYVPEMISYYLGEKQLLPDVATHRCWLDDERAHVLAHLDELVLTPARGSGGYGILFGPSATARQLAAARKQIRKDPWGWIARPVVQLSTVPTNAGGRLVPRHVGLRLFAVNGGGDGVFVLPGGWTRVALPEGSLVIDSDGGSKDTWVLAEGRALEAG
ncbi:circularly permuted type 2 ATP-grasp protein [Pseudonocardia acidicola]|uniref:Circularly permuted type 2 ATP-grasp protein n=1 Tax=Pseudonocardia acidicola TaxID=2724939 RepID=A0ABX1S539_9PSEU|nr:circularly permuted type 2 ATP-grasp protein [Pseudonocardia acidicola]NMH96711.1 circularly permuted type 2 ATP-grasp protein [Pseudonocardia acidicola]